MSQILQTDGRFEKLDYQNTVLFVEVVCNLNISMKGSCPIEAKRDYKSRCFVGL